MAEKTVARTIVFEEPGVVRLFSDGTILLINGRASHPHVFTAQEQTADNGSKSKAFNCGLYMPKATHKKAMIVCRDRIAELLLEAKIKAVANDKKFIKDGDTLAKDEAVGMWSVTAREKNRPGVRGNWKDPKTGKPARLNEEEHGSLIFGGCYVNLLIRPWVQDNEYGKRVNAGLVALYYRGPGEAYGADRISDDDIDGSSDVEGDTDDGGFDNDDDL